MEGAGDEDISSFLEADLLQQALHEASIFQELSTDGFLVDSPLL